MRSAVPVLALALGAVSLLLLSACAPGSGASVAAASSSAPHAAASGTSSPAAAPTPAASTGASDPADIRALEQVRAAAISSYGEGGDPGAVDCWTPSRHLVTGADSATLFRIICRVNYTEADATARWKDMICIGDFALDPMLESCYHWAPYSDMPEYGDGARLESAPTVPLG
ncbi:hypothetical protein [Schumannella soli]|uniref:Uncharacterized protein n=1 Tax=Schumannella soli TaxID=2590779 RepID=A0A506YAC6_9MICO|nr:hypothetical protein [Schumannella soli]TPW77419.1 hypothetical protein FJ657_01660 [Schumannella soli]